MRKQHVRIIANVSAGRNAPQNRLRFGGKIRPSGEPEGMARAKRAAEGGCLRASVCGKAVFSREE